MYQNTEEEYLEAARRNLAADPFLQVRFGATIEDLLSQSDSLRIPVIRWLALDAHVVYGLSNRLRDLQGLVNANSFLHALGRSLRNYHKAPENFRSLLAESRAASWASTRKLPFSLLRPDKVEFARAGQELYDLVFVKDGERRLASVKNAEEYNPYFTILSEALNYEELFNPQYRRGIDIQVRVLTRERSRNDRRSLIKGSVDHLVSELNMELMNNGERSERLRIADENCEFYVRYHGIVADGHLFLAVFGQGIDPLPTPLTHARMIAQLGHDFVPYTSLLQQEFTRFYNHDWQTLNKQHFIFVSYPGPDYALFQDEFAAAVRSINRAFGIKPYYLDTTFNADWLIS